MDTQIFGISPIPSNDNILQVHIESEVNVKEQGSDGRKIQVNYNRGFNTIADLKNQNIVDPKLIV